MKANFNAAVSRLTASPLSNMRMGDLSPIEYEDGRSVPCIAGFSSSHVPLPVGNAGADEIKLIVSF